MNGYQAAQERAERATRNLAEARADLRAAENELDAALADLSLHEERPGVPLKPSTVDYPEAA